MLSRNNIIIFLFTCLGLVIVAGINITADYKYRVVPSPLPKSYPRVAKPKKQQPEAPKPPPPEKFENELAKLVPESIDCNRWFGSHVAADGNTIVISYHGDSTIGEDIGSAYVYELQPDQSWKHVATLRPDERVRSNRRYGWSVAIQRDTIFVGGEWDAGANKSHCGAVYVYQRDETGQWSFHQKLTPSHDQNSQLFGSDVSIDGDLALIGSSQAWLNNDRKKRDAGAAYIFERNKEGNWIEKTMLIGENTKKNDQLGACVALSGNTAVVGSRHNEVDSGSAYVFRPDEEGNWKQVAILKAATPGNGKQFGNSVAIHGTRILVGEWRSGTAYLFEEETASKWNFTAILKSNAQNRNGHFGYQVDIRDDMAAIGTFTQGNDAVYLFRRDEQGNWNKFTRLQSIDNEHAGVFGSDFDIANNFILVGDEQEYSNYRSGGAAYIFEKPQVEEDSK
ncbi:MAG: hypothetical protein COA78_30715 [Blastopirellula sp.]|nr:MAG: hypothetical protein COA78_30715 [Blastopirellula sp.]